MQLNQEQIQAAHNKGPAQHLLVLAGAGTGKTRTIIARVAHLVKNGVPAKRLLLLTFTRRAAKEILARLASDLGPVTEDITAGTFHHFCLQVMRRAPKSFGVADRTIIDRDDAKSLLQLIRGELVEKKDQKEFPKAPTIQNYISYAKNSDLQLDDYLTQHTALSHAEIDKLMTIGLQYEARKRERGYLDFDDILHLFVAGLENNSELKNRIASLYQHILVDEMQDTNPLQWKIIHALTQDSKAQLFCVGDDAQSIYAFRGADFRNIHEFSQRLPNAEVLKLQENFRSTQEILDLANWLLAQSPLDYNKKLKAFRGNGAMPKLVDFENKFDEARWIADDLIERQESGSEWHEHMILVRSAWSAKALEGALIERSIPYRFIGGTSLLEAAHVKDILAVCRCALSKKDELGWIRYLKCWPRIGDATASKLVEKLSSADPADNAIDILTELLPTRPEIWEGVAIIQKHQKDPATAIYLITEHMKTLLSKRYDRWESRESDLQLLGELAERYKHLTDFVETYTLDPISNASAERSDEEDTVTVITVHSAKGAEAPVCYCLGVQPGMYPHIRSAGDEEAEEEERRILYVALTRAQDELIITRAGEENRTTMHGGSFMQNASSSYFLEYLPRELVTHEQFGYGLAFGGGSVLDELADFE